jgi:hypothetical protein
MTFAALDDTKNEALALKNADDNQELNYTVESLRDDKGQRVGAFAINHAVSIEGIPVMHSSAKMWEANRDATQRRTCWCGIQPRMGAVLTEITDTCSATVYPVLQPAVK